MRRVFSFIGIIVWTQFIASAPAIANTTYVSGHITSNMNWNTAGSPYIVTGNVYVDTGVTLSIEPAVEVKFDTLPGHADTLSLIVNGRLIAEGTTGNSITFTSIHESPEPGSWRSIKFSSGSVGKLTHCIIQYGGYAYPLSSYAIYSLSDSLIITNCTIAHNGDGIDNRGTATITNCTIAHNGDGIKNYNGTATITNCTFAHNYDGIDNHNGTMTITNSTITYNEHGIRNYGTANIEGCTIRKNEEYGILWRRGLGTIKNNLIIYQDHDGIRVGGAKTMECNNNVVANAKSPILHSKNVLQKGSILIEGNTITYNGWSGIVNSGNPEIKFNVIAYNDEAMYNDGNPILLHNTITHNSSGIFNCGNPVIDSSNIYENDPYWVNNRFSYDVDATDNWWGTMDTTIIDSFIYDYWDDNNWGKVIYMPILTSPDTLSPPPSPGKFQANESKGDKITVEWDPMPLADLAGYKVYYDKNSGHSYSGMGAIEGNSPIDVGNITSFELTGLDPGETYYLAATAYDNSGNEGWYSEEAVVTLAGVEESSNFQLTISNPQLSIYPNPSMRNVLIKYGLPEKANVSLGLYDISGRLVKTLYSGTQEKGYYEVDIKQDGLIGGIYFIRFETDKFKVTRKLTIIR